MAEDTKRQISQRRHKESITPEFHRNECIKYCTHGWYCGQELYKYFKVKANGKIVDLRKHFDDKAIKDHLIPYSLGGRGAKNLVPACGRCNNRKGALTLEEYRFQRFGALGGLFWAEKHEQNYCGCGDSVHTGKSNMVAKDTSGV